MRLTSPGWGLVVVKEPGLGDEGGQEGGAVGWWQWKSWGWGALMA